MNAAKARIGSGGGHAPVHVPAPVPKKTIIKKKIVTAKK